uniref:Uncharacterized protein n=1 Tax=Avena sativa TaxID=4498 RepID=A0ACD5Y5M9_AVESA
MAAPMIRNVMAQGALSSAFLQKDDGSPFLGELLRFLASALLALVAWIVAGIWEWVASMERRGRSALVGAFLAVAMVALVVLCCCCGYYVAGGGRGRRGPDREEAYGGHDGPVVRYGGRGRGGYRGGIFSMHPNKSIV